MLLYLASTYYYNMHFHFNVQIRKYIICWIKAFIYGSNSGDTTRSEYWREIINCIQRIELEIFNLSTLFSVREWISCFSLWSFLSRTCAIYCLWKWIARSMWYPPFLFPVALRWCLRMIFKSIIYIRLYWNFCKANTCKTVQVHCSTLCCWTT